MKPIAWIDEWIITNNRLVGRISGHPNQLKFAALYQVTSPIVRMPGPGLVETDNTLYILRRARVDYLSLEVV